MAGTIHLSAQYLLAIIIIIIIIRRLKYCLVYVHVSNLLL